MKKLFTIITFCFFAFIISAQTEAPTTSNAATPGNLSFSVTTVGSGANIAAIWIEDNANLFVKTLYVYNNNKGYRPELTNWTSKSGNNFVNATTGATRSHGLISANWPGKDKTLTTVLNDGTYYVKIETKEDGKAVKLGSFSFTKGTTSQTLNPAAITGSFTGISIQWTPTNTALTNVELSTLYSIYPNPAKESIYVNGPDIQSIDVFTLEGKRIFSSNQQKLNINALKKGTYLLNINTGKGIVSKKLIRN
jgi:hypothetical protein